MRGGHRISLVIALALCLTPTFVAEEKPSEKEKEAAPSKSTRPPKHLKKMPDGHWTAWDPPSPPAGSKVHIVVNGETLWGLSEENLKNPYLWPQIWDQNRYVADSHWIYPGDPIALPAPEVVPTEAPPAGTLSWTPAAGDETPPPAKPVPPPPAAPPPQYPVAGADDVYCATHIQDTAAPGDPHIVAAEDEAMIGIGQGNIVYLNAGSDAGWKPGDRFAVVRDRGLVTHPTTKKELGHRVDGLGALSLIAVQSSSATAEISFACEDLHKGDTVVPWREVSVPTRQRPLGSRIDRYNPVSSGKPSGYVVVSRHPRAALGQGNMVSVDLGESDGVEPGAVLTIFRPNPSGKDLPRLNLGEGVVVLVDRRSSVVRITASVREISLGDRVEVQ